MIAAIDTSNPTGFLISLALAVASSLFALYKAIRLSQEQAKNQKLVDQDKIRFSKLHERQAMILGELYGKIFQVEQCLKCLREKIENIGVSDFPGNGIDAVLEKLILRTDEAKQYFDRHQIYFDEDLVTKIRFFQKFVDGAYCAYLINGALYLYEDRVKSGMAKQTVDALNDEITGLEKDLTSLRNQFRRILGVNK